MVHIETYDSPEEMREALRQRAAHALAGLHSAQAALTFGDTWVRFVDIDNRLIEFGRIATENEIRVSEMRAGAQAEDAEGVVETARAELDEGYMYGIAYSLLNTGGEWGTTHKAHVWPIEDRLFRMAEEVEWKIDHLDDAGRILLELAFRQQRAHALPEKWGQ